MKAVAGTVLAFGVACNAPAMAASFHSQQILVLGSAQVDATGINNAGTIIGTTTPGQNQAPLGFVLNGADLSILENNYPTAINRSGSVTGFGQSNRTGFLWQNGSFVQSVSFSLGDPTSLLPGPVLSRHGEIAYTFTSGNSQQAFAGTQAGHFRMLKGVSAQNAAVSSINGHGVIAGTERVMVQSQQEQAVFVGKNGLYNWLLSPSLQNVSGGFVNDAGQLAYTDGSTGYVLSQGATTSFVPPEQTFTFQIQGINNRGRVVGVYTDTNGNPAMQHGFLFNGSTFSPIGAYGAGDTVHLAVNDRGIIVLSDQVAQSATVTSVEIRCSGLGC